MLADRWSDDIKCAQALLNFYHGKVCVASIKGEADVLQAVEVLKRTLELFEGVSNEGVKLKFLNTL